MLIIRNCTAIIAICLMILILSSPAFAASGDSGKVLNGDLIFGPDENLDPAYKYTGWYMHEAGIYETLFALDEKMNIIPKLATGFDQVSNTEYKIHLRPNVLFHDGTPLNAEGRGLLAGKGDGFLQSPAWRIQLHRFGQCG